MIYRKMTSFIKKDFIGFNIHYAIYIYYGLEIYEPPCKLSQIGYIFTTNSFDKMIKVVDVNFKSFTINLFKDDINFLFYFVV